MLIPKFRKQPGKFDSILESFIDATIKKGLKPTVYSLEITEPTRQNPFYELIYRAYIPRENISDSIVNETFAATQPDEQTLKQTLAQDRMFVSRYNNLRFCKKDEYIIQLLIGIPETMRL